MGIRRTGLGAGRKPVGYLAGGGVTDWQLSDTPLAALLFCGVGRINPCGGAQFQPRFSLLRDVPGPFDCRSAAPCERCPLSWGAKMAALPHFAGSLRLHRGFISFVSIGIPIIAGAFLLATKVFAVDPAGKTFVARRN